MIASTIVAPSLRAAGVALALQMAATGSAAGQRSPLASDGVLVTAARERPDSARAAITRHLVRAATDSASVTANLAAARAIALGYAVAWQDSFLVRQVSAFERWTPAQRAAKIAVDSVRVAGNAALGRAGVPTALRLWRQSLRLAVSLGDSAGQAAALGNLGAGFYRAGQLDSAAVRLFRALGLATTIGDHRTAGNALGTLASVSKDRGDLARAEVMYTRAADTRARSGDTRGLAADQNNLGLIAQTLNDLERARRGFEAALAINRREGRPAVAAVNLANLANLASLSSDLGRAATLYHEALAIYRATGLRSEIPAVLHNLGLLEMRRGDYRRAQRALEEAVAIADSTGAGAEAVAIRTDLAAVYGVMGHLQAALTTLRRAERGAVRQGAGSPLVGRVALAQADLAMQLNALADAGRQYTRAAALFRAAGDIAGESAARQGHGLLLLFRGEYADAAGSFAVAARARSAAGDRRSAASIERLRGYALVHQGDTAGGRRVLTAAVKELSLVGDVAEEAAALSALGDLARSGGGALAAESFYRRGLDRLAQLPVPEVRWQLHAGLGGALRSRGAFAEAATEMRAAIGDIERMSGSLRLEERRSAFLADKWDVFAQLALTERARGREGDAFAASERMRARQMLDGLARGRPAPVDRPDSASGRELDLRQRIAELTRSLGRGGSGDPAFRGLTLDASAANPAREALDAAQKAYADLLVEIRETNPSYARLVAGETADWREVAAKLTSDEVLLEYLTTDSATIVFVVTRDTIDAIEIDVSRRALTSLIAFAHGTLSRPGGSPTGTLWRSPLRRLAQLLLAPVDAAGHLAGKQALIIVPHAQLHFLPFHALLIESAPDRFLVERFRVSYAPSATLWLRLGGRPTTGTPGTVVAFAPRTDALPASGREVEAIGAIYGGRASVLVGAAASEPAFRALVPTRSIVHIATYGVLNKHNPLFSFVELAPQGREDGRLEVHELSALALSARLVVLSACRTALGSGASADVPPGDDWVGLVQGFLNAGAANVLATLWSVEDGATARLMSQFYRELSSGRSETAALAEAQRASLRDPRTAHPFYWAGFVLSGGR